VIEVKFVLCAAYHAFPAVSFPHHELYGCGNHSATLNVPLRWTIEALVSLNGNESIFKYLAVLIAFLPRID
jgi:hypothetical protein